MTNFLLNIIIITLLIVVLVFVHELGHFLVAKACKMLVREFSIGMGPIIKSFKRGETKYSIRALPIGGFVDILGESCEDDNCKKSERENKRSFVNKPIWQRILVIGAGVTMNFFLAAGIFHILLAINNYSVPFSNEGYEYKPVFGEIEIERFSDLGYTEIMEDGTAKMSSMPANGYITSINGQKIEYYSDLLDVLGENAGKGVSVTVCDDSPYYYEWSKDVPTKEIECNDYPVTVNNDGVIGISLNINNSYNKISYKGSGRFFAGLAHSVNFMHYTSFIVPKFIGSYIQKGDYESVAVQSVSSPIAIYFVVDELKTGGWEPILQMGAMMSLSLAFVNLLPIPALDGGRIFLLVIEAVIRRPLNRKFEVAIVKYSFYGLLVLMILVVLKDIIYIKVLQNLFK